MLSVDEILKIILVLAVAFAIIGIAYGLIRVLLSLAGTIGETKKFFGQVNSDYEKASVKVFKILDVFENIATNVIDPIGKLLTSAVQLLNFVKRKKKEDEEE